MDCEHMEMLHSSPSGCEQALLRNSCFPGAAGQHPFESEESWFDDGTVHLQRIQVPPKGSDFRVTTDLNKNNYFFDMKRSIGNRSKSNTPVR